MEIHQLTLTKSQKKSLLTHVDDGCTDVAKVQEALEYNIKMYEQTILDTPPNEDGSDILIPNFLIVGYRTLKNEYSVLMQAIELKSKTNVKNSYN